MRNLESRNLSGRELYFYSRNNGHETRRAQLFIVKKVPHGYEAEQRRRLHEYEKRIVNRITICGMVLLLIFCIVVGFFSR